MQSAYSSLSSSPTALQRRFSLVQTVLDAQLFELVSGSIFNPELPPHFSHLRANYLIGKRDSDVGGGEFVIVLLHCLCLASEDVISRRHRMVTVFSTVVFEGLGAYSSSKRDRS